MTEAEIRTIFEPVITDALNRLHRRTKATGDDVARTLGPVFDAVARAAGAPQSDIAERLGSWVPAEVTEARVYAAAREIVSSAAPNVADVEFMKRRTEELEREMRTVRSADRPAVGPDRVWN
jgi:hypothetical protein